MFCLARFGVLFCRVVLGCHCTALSLQNRVVSGVSFLTEGVFECDLAYRRSVAVLCMLYKIRRHPMDAPFLWCSSSAICAGAGHVRRGDSISVHLCASSLQNLAAS